MCIPILCTSFNSVDFFSSFQEMMRPWPVLNVSKPHLIKGPVAEVVLDAVDEDDGVRAGGD